MDATLVRRVAIVCAAAMLVLLAGCGDDSGAPAATASNFPSGVCSSITTWSHDLVAAANAFDDESVHLSVDGRRARYLFAFDDQRRITDELRTNIEQAPPIGIDDPDAVRAALLSAVDDVTHNIADQKADAAEHVNFTLRAPRPDRLHAGTEKSLSLMLKPLDELSRTTGIAELGGGCGR